MRQQVVTICDKIIFYSFCTLFFFTPLMFTGINYELFEFNKMWITFGLTILIACCWITKIIMTRTLTFQRTPLDLPILLFVLSQIIATIHSLDPYVSLWGYYSRFNGGLLSILTYIFLYYAFINNIISRRVASVGDPHRVPAMKMRTSDGGEARQDPEQNPEPIFVKKVLWISLISGCIVALWGFPSHFGFDPTCFLFRGAFDVSCWTDAFQPKVRIFSTLGQPNWLAVYLAVLLPVCLAFALKTIKNISNSSSGKQPQLFKKISFLAICYLLLAILFYVDLLFTNSRSGFLGFAIGFTFFAGILVWKELRFLQKNMSFILCCLAGFVIISLLTGTPISPSIAKVFSHPGQSQAAQTHVAGSALETGGTESGEIRKIVWSGATDIWKHYPLFGTGVETFAFSYYLYRPVAHNMTSEWDYLYNKAHNEYLNYLATTGIVGLGTYLAMIGLFIFLTSKYILSSLHNASLRQDLLFIVSLLAGYIAILISNFFGFSVVIVNLYLFMIPAFVFLLSNKLQPSKQIVLSFAKDGSEDKTITALQWIMSFLVVGFSLYQLLLLIHYWQADVAYALGNNLDRANEYEKAYPHLVDAVTLRPDEPQFQDETAINNAFLSEAFALQKDATNAARFAAVAISTNNNIIKNHPNNIVFWKSRVRIFYALSQNEEQYLPIALDAIEHAHQLAPTDAKVMYNLGILYGQNGYGTRAIQALEETVKLKPDFRDAHYALGLFYHEMAIDKKGKVTNTLLQKKAVDTMQYILQNFSKNDPDATKSLREWQVLK